MTTIPAMRPTVHLDLHYQHTLLVEFVLALLWKLLGAIVALCRWLFPAFDSTRTPRHDIEAVHPGATVEYAEVLHEQNTPTEPLPLLCGDTIVLHLADLDPLTDTAWWRGGELAVSDA